MKTCHKCKVEKEEKDFNCRSLSPDGLQSICRMCDSIKSREYRERNALGIAKTKRQTNNQKRQRLFEIFGDSCKECGSQENLNFHHRNPSTKEFSIASGLGREWERLLTEAEKCDVLCRGCHEERHRPQHGTISMYTYGCRCDLCRTTRREWQREYDKKRSRKRTEIVKVEPEST